MEPATDLFVLILKVIVIVMLSMSIFTLGRISTVRYPLETTKGMGADRSPNMGLDRYPILWKFGLVLSLIGVVFL